MTCVDESMKDIIMCVLQGVKGKLLTLIQAAKEANELTNVRPQYVNFTTEPPNINIGRTNEDNKTESLLFTSQISKEIPKYNNTYTFAGQTNISISPSSIPNPNPSTLGMKMDTSFPPYGPYIFPIQGFTPYQTLYPSIIPMAQTQNASEKLRVSAGVQHDGMNVAISQNIEDNIESNNLSQKLAERDVAKGNEMQQKIVSSPDDDKNVGIKGSKTKVETKNAPLKVDKQTGPGSNNFNKFSKISTISEVTVSTSTMTSPTTVATNTFNTNNGSFTLKTSIPISKIDIRSIPQPAVRNKAMEIIEPKSSDVQVNLNRNQTKQLETQANTKKDMQQNFFHQGNAVVHPHNIIKMLVPPQTSNDIQNNAENKNRNKPQIISDILLKPIDVLHKSPENIMDTAGTINPPITIANSNYENKNEEIDPLIQNQTKPVLENSQMDVTKDIKKQYVFIPNAHMANKLLLSISSKQASTPIILPKIQNPEEGKMAPFAIPKLPDRFKDTSITESSALDNSSKVVALKRLHHENYDENDFENLITENQIYGNKIVIKEKSQPVFIHPSNVATNKNKLNINETVTTKDTNAKANVVVQPNFLYVSNVKFQPNSSNFMVINNSNNPVKNDQALHKGIEAVKTETNNQTNQNGAQNKVMFGSQTFRSVNPLTHTVSYVKTSNVISENNKQSTVLQTLLTKPNVKTNEGNKTAGQKVLSQLINNKIVYQVPMIIDRNNVTNRAVNVVKPTYLNSELAMLLTKTKTDQIDLTNVEENSKYVALKGGDVQNYTYQDSTPKIFCNEVSSLDLAEKRKVLRDKRRLLLSKTSTLDENKCILKEKEKYLSSQHHYCDDETDESEDLSEDEDVTNLFTKNKNMPLETCGGKLEFLNMFGLTTKSVKKEKELDKLERSLQMDLVTLANVAAKAERLTDQIDKMDSVEYGQQPFGLPIPIITENPINNENIKKITDKIVFMNELKLGMVPQSYKIEHEMMWQCVLKDRKRRNGRCSFTDYLDKMFKAQNFSNFVNNNNIQIDLHTKDQLETMTKIKQSVLENNNLIKLKLDKLNQTNKPDNDIPVLAEKNFCELQKLSHMANKSLSILRVSQDLKDSFSLTKQSVVEDNLKNVQQHLLIPTRFERNYSSQLNIPKIVSLKSIELQCNNMDILPATSMDEPRNSAGGINNSEILVEKVKPVSNTQMTETKIDGMSTNYVWDSKPPYLWPGVQAVMDSYRAYASECDAEKQRLTERNDCLRNDIALQENDVACLGAHLRILLAEQQMCEEQRQSLQKSIDFLNNCIAQIIA